MPIYEFYCPENHRIYSFLARSPALGNRIPRCPDNPRYRLVKEFSPFAVSKRRATESADGESGEDLPGGDPDPRMEAAMADMERDMAGMDEENPDPRRLASMMRRMAQITGESIPAPLEEMMARMEKGEDPEQLEEEYGDLLDETLQDDAEAESANSTATVRSTLRRSLPPRRDPTLYEMRDYLED